ncbi:Gfo/Idh/MocA family protein [Alkalihalobacillus pseudalcaliphilus]|uniref:Gfo/Idh/MocA family protein n=1 Tax=Alkalihalobacillus pseudalcaliphilus TaxID=79884 RepID=UPI00064D92AA|nr:Gfo/Idh/MocA family oxidoreductase [Alkalihalobacillus pseudalcaliphilus]KMK75243.1 oxidoreductase [Alkalihalobacillus pseudalcaliphilus]
MKVGIIGGGFGLKVQAPIIHSYQEMELVAVCTMVRHQLPQEFMSWNERPTHYTDWEIMLECEELDLVFVSSLPIYHFSMVKAAMERDIHVVCEKPFMMNSNESAKLIELNSMYKGFIMVDFEWRFLPARQKVKELVQTHKIGKALHYEYHISYANYQRLLNKKLGWMGEKSHFGGMFGAIGTHMIDCLRWLLQDEVHSINGLLHTHVPFGAGEMRDADDAFFLHGQTEKGSTFSIQLISGIHHGFGSTMKIFGSEGTVILENDTYIQMGRNDTSLETVELLDDTLQIPKDLSQEASSYYPAFLPFINKVYNQIIHHKIDKDVPTILDGHKNQLVLEKVLKSS